MSQTSIFVKQYRLLEDLKKDSSPILLIGDNLLISHVVSVALYEKRSEISAKALESLESSLEALGRSVEGGDVIYGVNTGFGGTADVRTSKILELQRVLVRELHYGILPHPEQEISSSRGNFDAPVQNLPYYWTRAAILIRINSLIKGCSGIRPIVVERMQDLLLHDIIPLIPLRGSISASGDLSPLSYIAGAVQGNPNIQIHANKGEPVYADTVFQQASLDPVILQEKEGLAIVNGTAISTAAGVMVLHATHKLAVLSQILTAMSVEALGGTTESFHPFFAQVRPHPGQVESAANILSFLENSKLTKVNTGAGSSLRQDRYSIRTTSQWIGPILEDLVLANQQITIECNSATDNPLITPSGNVLNGGNFQAKAVTSAMEKTRQGIEGIGRMLFTQCSEMINPATSRGLPPNLVAEDPSTSFIFKGTDMNIASLQAELGFLSAPMNHVQNAEMGNQSLNSLALISARYTNTACEVLSQLIALHLVAVCQALDLRAMHLGFLEQFRPVFEDILRENIAVIEIKKHKADFEDILWARILQSFDDTVSLDTKRRFQVIGKALRPTFLEETTFCQATNGILELETLTKAISESLEDSWCRHRDAYLDHGDAEPYLGRGTKIIYRCVRDKLGVPMLSSSKLRTPDAESVSLESGERSKREPKTVGSYNSIVYRAISDDTLANVALEILEG